MHLVVVDKVTAELVCRSDKNKVEKVIVSSTVSIQQERREHSVGRNHFQVTIAQLCDHHHLYMLQLFHLHLGQYYLVLCLFHLSIAGRLSGMFAKFGKKQQTDTMAAELTDIKKTPPSKLKGDLSPLSPAVSPMKEKQPLDDASPVEQTRESCDMLLLLSPAGATGCALKAYRNYSPFLYGL